MHGIPIPTSFSRRPGLKTRQSLAVFTMYSAQCNWTQSTTQSSTANWYLDTRVVTLQYMHYRIGRLRAPTRCHSFQGKQPDLASVDIRNEETSSWLTRPIPGSVVSAVYTAQEWLTTLVINPRFTFPIQWNLHHTILRSCNTIHDSIVHHIPVNFIRKTVFFF